MRWRRGEVCEIFLGILGNFGRVFLREKRSREGVCFLIALLVVFFPIIFWFAVIAAM